MNKMDKSMIGQKVILKTVGNNARYNMKVEEYEVKKVGRKYFEVWKSNQEYTTVKFNLDDNTQTSDYIADWKLYFSEQEMLDEAEETEITSKLRSVFGSYGKLEIPLEKLRKIKDIIDSE